MCNAFDVSFQLKRLKIIFFNSGTEHGRFTNRTRFPRIVFHGFKTWLIDVFGSRSVFSRRFKEVECARPKTVAVTFRSLCRARERQRSTWAAPPADVGLLRASWIWWRKTWPAVERGVRVHDVHRSRSPRDRRATRRTRARTSRWPKVPVDQKRYNYREARVLYTGGGWKGGKVGFRGIGTRAGPDAPAKFHLWEVPSE